MSCTCLISDVSFLRFLGVVPISQKAPDQSYFTDQPHIAGTERDIQLAHYIHDMWINHGLDNVELIPYNVLLSYPNPDKPNEIFIVDDKGEACFKLCNEEKVLKGKSCTQAYNAYSPKGNVLADPVYVNYGRDEDFDTLKDLGIEVKGKICLARYGKIYRGKKVSNAAKRGSVGMLLFLCPTDVAVYGTDPENTYPNTWWMPSDAIQRGDIREEKGDPQTPGYPSIDGAYRIPIENIHDFPKIPCQPIGYGDAITVLQQLGGNLLPKEWLAMDDVTFVGPGFKDTKRKLRLNINNEYKQAVCYNVIGVIEGSVEPDRYVILGNHRDAWVYGGADPSSGTAQMCEVSRVMGCLKEEGWKPNRTIIFCSWGGEEFGLIGSTEWIEEHLHSLQTRTVAYINVDICVAGEIFHPEASALLEDVLMETSSLVPDAKDPKKSVYEAWRDYLINLKREIRVDSLGPGTDHIPFYFYAGIPSINLSWLPDTEKYPTLFLHPAYHTAYDNFDMIERLIDPDFNIHKTCARFCCLLLLRLSCSDVLPHKMYDLANRITEAWAVVRDQLQKADFKIDHLEKAIMEFEKIANDFERRVEDIDPKNSLAVRGVNDQMIMIEKIFVTCKQPKEINLLRHMIFTPYQKRFPSLTNTLIKNRKSGDQNTKCDMEKYISDIMIAMKAAKKFLLKPGYF